MSNISTNDPIDFVIIWVDGNDQDWLAEKNHYAFLEKGTIDSSNKRYRDFGLLKYLFRGIESFAPWVNKVYFVTNGQLPDWLNLNAEKLMWIKHEDYISREYLPVFSANPIELSLHKIEGLSDKFVFFNDDFYLIRPVSKSHFFCGNLPVLCPQMSYTVPTHGYDQFAHLMLNNVMIINKNFNAKKVILNNWINWLSPLRVGPKTALNNFRPVKLGYFTGFSNPHLPSPFLKEVYEEVWEKEPKALIDTMKHRFRSNDDATQYVFYDWQLASNRFKPIRRKKLGKYFEVTTDKDNNTAVCDAIINQKYPSICINDAIDDFVATEEFKCISEELSRAFETILPNKCSFEV